MKLVAHKGGRGDFVQNTKEAFLSAFSKYDIVECDVQVSSDDEFFICHDEVTSSYLFYEENIKLTSEPISKIRKLVMHENNFTSTPMLLSELLTLAKKHDKEIIVEVKESSKINEEDFTLINKLSEIIKHAKARVQVLSKVKNVCLKAKQLGLKTVKLILKEDNLTEELNWALSNRISVDVEKSCALRRRDVKKFHDQNLDVNIWTVDSLLSLGVLIKLEPDFVTTNDLIPDEVNAQKKLKKALSKPVRTGLVVGVRSGESLIRNILITLIGGLLSLLQFVPQLKSFFNFAQYLLYLITMVFLILTLGFITRPLKVLSVDEKYLYIHGYTKITAISYETISKISIVFIRRENTKHETGTLDIKLKGSNKVYKITSLKFIRKTFSQISEMRNACVKC